MPYDDQRSQNKSDHRKYILTHGLWTIVGSYKELEKANKTLSSVKSEFVNNHVRPPCEKEIQRFWPEFEGRFKYLGYKGSVLAKVKSEREFRSAITFKHKSSNVIYVVPGKISNIFDVEDEVVQLIEQPKKVKSTGKYEYAEHGVLHEGMKEVTEKPKNIHRNTCELQTYREYFSKDRKDIKEKQRFFGKVQNQYSLTGNPNSFVGNISQCSTPIINYKKFEHSFNTNSSVYSVLRKVNTVVDHVDVLQRYQTITNFQQTSKL